jgi:hypothetical protein
MSTGRIFNCSFLRPSDIGGVELIPIITRNLLLSLRGLHATPAPCAMPPEARHDKLTRHMSTNAPHEINILSERVCRSLPS